MISPLRKSRFFSELSIYDLSLKTGIDPARISLIERGYTVPNAGQREKLAQALGCKTEDLFPEIAESVSGLWMVSFIPCPQDKINAINKVRNLAKTLTSTPSLSIRTSILGFMIPPKRNPLRITRRASHTSHCNA